VTTGSSLEQILKVTDDDVNGSDITAQKIYIRNLGTASGDEIHQIQVKAGTTTLVSITQPNALFDNFKAGMTIPFTTTKLVTDDNPLTIKIYYEIGTPVDGHTLRPVAKVQGREGGVDYWSDEATYPDVIALYQPGFEIVENITPPEGGTAYSGQRLLAQKIHLAEARRGNRPRRTAHKWRDNTNSPRQHRHRQARGFGDVPVHLRDDRRARRDDSQSDSAIADARAAH